MKQGFNSLVELAQELTRQASAKQDYIVPAASMSVSVIDSSPSLNFNGDNAPMNEYAVRQIDSYLGIPAQYADKMRREAPGLWKLNADQWLQQANGDRRMVRTRDGEVRAFVADSYKRIDNFEVAEVALNALRDIPDLRIVSSAITESRLYIKAVSSAIQLPVAGSRRVGDIVEAGVMVSNSEIGQGAVSVKPFANFLVCTNGMVRDKSGLRAAHIGRKKDDYEGLLSDQTKQLEDAAILSKVKDVLETAFDLAEFQKWIDRMSEQTGQMLTGNPAKAVEVLGSTFGMTQAEGSSILRNLVAGGDLSRFGLMNAVTRSAEDLASYDRATEFETFGGKLVELSRSDWNVIAVAE